MLSWLAPGLTHAWEAEAGIWLEPHHPTLGLQEGRSACVLEVNSAVVDKGRKPDAIDTREQYDNSPGHPRALQKLIHFTSQ